VGGKSPLTFRVERRSEWEFSTAAAAHSPEKMFSESGKLMHYVFVGAITMNGRVEAFLISRGEED
jgi:hypothetical protein